MRRTEIALVSALAAAAAWLLLGGLGDHVLWLDEAETGLLGLATLRHGVPLATAFGLDRAWQHSFEIGPTGLWTWHPWLQFYLAAASLAAFGRSAAGARALFAACSLAAAAETWRFGRRWLGPAGAALAAVLLLSNSTFLVYARQCRWYGPAMLLTVLAVDLADAFAASPTRARAVKLGLALAGLFHANTLVFAGVASALGGAWLAALARGGRRQLRPGLEAAGTAAALTVPWLLWVSPTSVRRGFAGIHAGSSLSAAKIYLLQLNHFVLPLSLALVPAAAWAAGRPRASVAARLSAACCAGLWIGVSLSPVRFFRYLAPALPLGALLSAAAVSQARSLYRPAAVLLSGLLLLTQALQNLPYLLWFRGAERKWLQPPIADFLQERLRPSARKDDCLTRFVASRARPGETVLIAESAYPLTFHAGVEVRNPIVTGRVPETDWVIEGQPFQVNLEESVRLEGSGAGFRTTRLLCPTTGVKASSPEPIVHDFGWNADGMPMAPIIVHERLAPATAE